MIERNKKRVLVVFDRDGTLIYDNDGYFGKNDNWQKQIKFYDGAVKIIKALNNFADVIVATNQIGIAMGFYEPERVKEINQYIDNLFKEQGAKIDGWYFSPYVEKSWAKKKGLDLNSPWIFDTFPENRKPQIGMIKLAVADLKKSLSFYKKIFVIGDSLDDINMALNLNGIGIFFENEKNSGIIEKVKFLESVNQDRIFRINNLISAVKIIKNES